MPILDSVKPKILKSGFTIVELLIVIVVIGILAAITVISYIGVNQRAIAASLQSDLSGASKKLSLYYVEYGKYPEDLDGNDCPTVVSDVNYCLKSSPDNDFDYSSSTPFQTYTLEATNTNAMKYRITNNSVPTLVVAISCPSGFIVVPGSVTYGTNDFCVMKYEAKQVGATNVPISTASGLPWVNITQTEAISNSSNVSGCTGCHLISESEWLTIVQNVLNVPSNWSTGTVGSGYIYSGHNDGTPIIGSLEAGVDDGNGYYGTGHTLPSNQRRTLTLSNGEVIWDIAGNVSEWTSGTIAGGQQPGLSGETSYSWKQWNNVSLIQNGLPISAMPGYTGISGASNWSSTQYIGKLYSNYGEASTMAVSRGGCYAYITLAGVFSMSIGDSPAMYHEYIGFRVTR